MALAIPAAIPAFPRELEIVEVRTQERLVAFRETAFRGFGYPVAAAHIFLADRLLASSGVRLYAGLVDGALIATSMTVATGAIAGIYWVATLEEQRGKGYGAALTWAAVRGGGEAGGRIASLQASKLGRPVYARMGFEHVLDYEHLSPPEV
jgi:GNAT superfamily N-acetyltransferase